MKNPVIASLFISIFFYILFLVGNFSPLDNKFYDRNFLGHKLKVTDNPVVILAIDEFSIEKNHIWPWPRKIYCDLLEILQENQANTIAFDISFDSYTSYNKLDDITLGQAIGKKGNVILASQLIVNKHETVLLQPVPEIGKSAKNGLVNIQLDRDAIVRRYRLALVHEGKSYNTLALETASKYLRTPAERLLKTIPLDQQNSLLINFIGPANTFPIIPIAKVFEKNFFTNNPNILKNKIVLIGATAKYLQDFSSTPTALKMSGVEINANIIYNLVKKNFFHELPLTLYFLLLLLFTLSASLVASKLRLIESLLVYAALNLVYFSVCRIAFVGSYIIYLTAPLTSMFTGYASFIIIKLLSEEKEKNEIKRIFNQYISPIIVNDLLTNKDRLKMGGEKKEVTVFFSDIRNFTSFCETHTAEQVIEQLNEYFDAMINVVYEFQGTLDKFVGDEIMAIWGAPLSQDNHALLAVKAGVKQLAVLKELQSKWERENKTVLDIGIGINSGEVVVGNIGAEKYKNYTVIGDTVNTAYRLQDYTKTISASREQKCRLIISESTKLKIEAFGEFSNLGEIQVKGKREPIRVWEVICLKQ